MEPGLRFRYDDILWLAPAWRHRGKGLPKLNLAEARAAIRQGAWTAPTTDLAPGHVQANLVILPRAHAYDFLLFCARNPRPCPVLEVTEPGSPVPVLTAPGADLRTDLPRYRIFRQGQLAEEVTEIASLWEPDWVGFLLGCSFTFDALLRKHGLPVRHIEEGRNVPMYRTKIPCRAAGIFTGPLVVSMRPMRPADAARASELTTRYRSVHGAPVWCGAPEHLGIRDLARPDYGDAVTVHSGETPVFWACGVTSQAALENARLPLAVTHAPGHMFLTDLRLEDLE